MYKNEQIQIIFVARTIVNYWLLNVPKKCLITGSAWLLVLITKCNQYLLSSQNERME